MSTVKTRTGVLRGIEVDEGVQAFLGVPFAQAPVGDLRWKAPVALDDSDAEVDCTALGRSAWQKEDPVMVASLRPKSEDCLTLNVWTKDAHASGKPVMVYIHGGSYMEGGSSDPLYDGTNTVARHDVVFVSINYRLNIFGFMNWARLPGGDAYPDSGYLGIMDQTAALAWVHENIAAFGGDPDRITIFGESCGGGSVCLQTVAPAAKGLFSQAIVESGPIQLYSSPDVSTAFAREFMERMGASTVQELAARPAEELMAFYDGPWFESHLHDISLMFAPTCDGGFLPSKPLKAFHDGAAAGITMMIGTNADEFSYWRLYFKDLATEMPAFWHGNAAIHFDGLLDHERFEAAWADAHPDVEPGRRYLDYTNQIGFQVGSELMAEYQSAHDPVYFYLFDYASKIPNMGSAHAVELPFVMNNTSDPGLIQGLTGEVPPQHLADQMNQAWAAFARTGRPAADGAPEWRAYTVGDRETMCIDEHRWELRRDANTANVELLRPAFDECLIQG